MAHEQLAHGALAVDAERHHGTLHLRLGTAGETLERGNHLVAAGQLGGTGVGTELALTAEPHDDDGGEHAEHHLQHEHGDHVGETAGAAALFLVVGAEEVADDAGHDAGEEHHEGVHHPLDQGQGHHVAVGHVAHLVGQHGFRLVAAHAVEQTGGDGDEGVVTAGAGGKGVHLGGVVDPHFRHLDASLTGLTGNSAHQPVLGLVAGLLDDLDAIAALGHPLGHQQGDKGTPKTEHGTEHQQTGNAGLVDPQNREQDIEYHPQHQHDGQVGHQE